MNRLICPLPVVPLRKEPSDRSEMTSQVLFGETMTLLDQNEKWAMIRLDHDQYEGWVDKKQIAPEESEYKQPFEFNRSLFAITSNSSGQPNIIPCGSPISNRTENSFSVGKNEFTLKDLTVLHPSPSIIDTAKLFLGSPYLWGGRTFMGIDCSGFTQIVMRVHGISIPRDAYQQADLGDALSFIEESKTGDLAFFDNAEGRITHVGIIFLDHNNQRKIIHASGFVRIDSIDHQGIFNQETGSYSHNLRIIKRII